MNYKKWTSTLLSVLFVAGLTTMMAACNNSAENQDNTTPTEEASPSPSPSP